MSSEELSAWFKESGNRHVPERLDNHLDFQEKSVIKTSQDLSGEIWWYQHIPDEIQDLFPQLLSAKPPTQYEMELIDGLSLSYLYIDEKMTPEILHKLLTTIERIHNTAIEDEVDQVDYAYNYLDKLSNRYSSYDYSQFPGANLTFQRIFEYFENYVRQKRIIPKIIHGDPVFSNILITPELEFKFVDMRGLQGTAPTIWGDMWYDYGKIYQSLMGYDEILLDSKVNDDYRQKLVTYFEEFIVKKWGLDQLERIKWITASLIFSLIPLHDNTKCTDYYKLIENLIPLA